MKRQEHLLLSVLIIRNDDWKITYTAFAKPSHSLKHRRRVKMHPWILSNNLHARWTDWKILRIVFIYMPLKGDLIKERRDIGRDRFLIRRFSSM